MLVRSLAIEFWYVGKYVGRMVSDEMRCLVELKLFKFLIRRRLSFQFDYDTRIFSLLTETEPIMFQGV